MVSGSSKPTYMSPRFYICDPECPKKCSEEKKELCVTIYEVVEIKLEFLNKCFFDCANICYEYQLEIYNEGSCPPPLDDGNG
ncbi:unnamed protein product [Allacma fusca]|uniref:Uncharacterized protein n=1 Tax=Allacma fusca TaxID=39272 RepID=A0A8J2NHJ3_9HEXA|nr:unnamed protein product [Allacma fusca]